MISALPEIPEVEIPDDGWGEWILTGIGTALDAAVVRGMQIAIDRLLMPEPEEAAQMLESARPYMTDDLQRNPHCFFAFVDQPAPDREPTAKYRRALPGGAVLSLRFDSGYEPYWTDGKDEECPENDTILVEHWRHQGERPAATVITLHGFTMGDPRIDAFVLFASHWFARGFDVALLTLPYHGRRSPKQARFSGERFASPHVGHLNEAVRQSVHDVRLVTRWIREQTSAPVGLLGLSLGGYIAALMAGLTDDIDFAVPMVPPVCFGDLAWRFFRNSRMGHGDAAPVLSPETFRVAYRVHSPLIYPLRLPRERVLIVAGRGDRIVPPAHPHALWRHWGEPAIHWFSGSHLAPFRRWLIAAAIDRHLEQIL